MSEAPYPTTQCLQGFISLCHFSPLVPELNPDWGTSTFCFLFDPKRSFLFPWFTIVGKGTEVGTTFRVSQGLFLPQCSGVTPGGTQGIMQCQTSSQIQLYVRQASPVLSLEPWLILEGGKLNNSSSHFFKRYLETKWRVLLITQGVLSPNFFSIFANHPWQRQKTLSTHGLRSSAPLPQTVSRKKWAQKLGQGDVAWDVKIPFHGRRRLNFSWF